MLHFAYGSNMHRAVMRRHAAAAEPMGVARLADFRFVITTDGYASIEPPRAGTVHGVLWRLTPRDRATLDIWENVAGGLYRAETLAVEQAGGRRPALVYVARPRPPGRPETGLHGDRRCGGARVGNAAALHSFAARLATAPSAWRRSPQAWRIRLKVHRYVLVRGRVQGVGFRAWTEVTALERHLQGWVRNRRDGAVEALFSGLETEVLAMIDDCRSGPPGARVDFIDHREAAAGEVALRRGDELFSVLGTV